MQLAGGRFLYLLGTVIPLLVVAGVVWYAASHHLSGPQLDWPLANLSAAARGVVFAGVMLTCGTLLAVAFANLDRALRIGTAAHCNGRRGKQH